MESLVTVETLRSWLKLTDNSQDDSLELYLDIVSSSALKIIGTPSWSTNDDVPGDVKWVIIRVASRIYNNPTDAVQSTTGPFSNTYKSPYFTDDEIGTLLQYSSSSSSSQYDLSLGMFSVQGKYRADLNVAHEYNGIFPYRVE